MRELFHRTNLIKHLVARGSAQFLAKWFDNGQWRNAGAHGYGHELRPAPQKRWRHLREGIVQLGAHLSLIVPGQTPVTHVPHDANDFVGRGAIYKGIRCLNARHVRNPKTATDGIPAAERAFGKDVVHDNHKLASQAVVIVNEPAFQQRNSHHLEIVRRGAAGQDHGQLFFLRHVGGCPVSNLVVARSHGNDVYCRDRLHARNAPRAVDHLLPARGNPRGICQRRGREAYAHDEQISDVEARIERSSMEQGASKHSRSNQQNDCQGNFRDNKRGVKSARATSHSPCCGPQNPSNSRTGARHAGASPNSKPLKTDTPTANRSTRQSTWTSSMRGKSPGQKVRNGLSPTLANMTPSSPPARPRSALSVRLCRTKRPRLAPSATRMANSRSRETARASIKLATFAHAISSTRPTAPSKSQSVDPVSPTSARNSFTCSERPLFVSAKACAKWFPVSATSACACASVAPDRKRPITWTGCAARLRK